MEKKKKSKLKIFLIVLLILIILIIGSVTVLYLLYANKEKKELEYSVKYLVDGEVYKEEMVKYNSTLELEELKKDGYVFSGWFEGNTKYDDNIEIKKDTILEAKFEAFANYVLFDDTLGNKTKVNVQYNEVVKPIIDPTRNGYKFIGWYYNDKKFDFNTKITNNITLIAKWEKINEKVGVNTDGYFKTYIDNQINFSTNYKDNKLDINIKSVTNKVSNLIDNVIKNTDNIINRSDIKNIIVKYNGNKYEINKDNVKEIVNNLFKDLTDTSSLKYEERMLSSLYKKEITVEFVIDSNNYYLLNNSNKYNIVFNSNNIVSKEYMDNNSYKSVDYIKVYDVSFNTNHNIYCKFSSSYSDLTIANVLTQNSHAEGGNGTGLNDALTNFASNPHLANLVIKLPNGETTELTRKQLLNVKNGGLSLIRFGNAILKGLGVKGSLTSAKHGSFAGKTLTFTVTLLDGYAFEDGFNNEYKIIISSK